MEKGRKEYSHPFLSPLSCSSTQKTDITFMTNNTQHPTADDTASVTPQGKSNWFVNTVTRLPGQDANLQGNVLSAAILLTGSAIFALNS